MKFKTFDEAWEKSRQKWTRQDKPCSLACLDEDTITFLVQHADDALRFVDATGYVEVGKFCVGYHYKSSDGSPERRLTVSIKQYDSVEAAEAGAHFYLSKLFNEDPVVPVGSIKGRKALGQRAWRLFDCIAWRHGTSMLFVKRFNDATEDYAINIENDAMTNLIQKIAWNIEKHLMSLPCPEKEMAPTFTPCLKSKPRVTVTKGEDVIIELEEAPCLDNIHHQRFARLWPPGVLRPWPYEPVGKAWRFVAEEVREMTVTLLVASKTLLWPRCLTVQVEVLPQSTSEQL